MNRSPYRPWLPLIIIFMLACGPASPATPVAQLLPTRTPLPTFTPTSNAPTITPTSILVASPTPAPAMETPTPIPPTATPTDTPVAEAATETPVPELQATDTPIPPPTNTPPPPTPVPPPTNTPVPTPSGPFIGQFGISGRVVARDKMTFAVGEKAFFTYEATNHTENPVAFTLLGIKASNGHFNTSWINPDVIVPGVPFRHDDGLAFDTPGTYQVFLAICYSDCGGAGAVWEEYHDGAATITVQ